MSAGGLSMVEHIEGVGGSLENPVKLEARDHMEGISAEYSYLEDMFGAYGRDWEILAQEIVCERNRYYDRMALRLSDGTVKVIYFDITGIFGKMWREKT